MDGDVESQDLNDPTSRPTRPLNLLLVAFDYPPYVGGGGSIRMRKLVKYLARDPQLAVSVLTGGWESRDAAPGLRDRPADVPLHVAAKRPVNPDRANQAPRRAWTWAGIGLRSLLQMPDNRFRFLPRLVSVIRRLDREQVFDLILITSPPNSMGLLLPLLRVAGLRAKLLLDVRDMWALDPLLSPNMGWFRAIQARLERWALRHADALVTVTPGYQRWLLQQMGGRVPVYIIHNGYDEEDWRGLVPRRVWPGTLLISHAGSLGGINGPRTTATLAQALDILLARRPDLRGSLAFQFIGNMPVVEQEQLMMRSPDVRFEFAGFLPHGATLERLAASDALLLLHFDLPHCDIIYPGKLFEYYRMALPVLACSPPGHLRDFVDSRDMGECADYADPQAVALALERLADRLRQGPGYALPGTDVTQFERGQLAVQYAGLIRGVMAGR